MSSKIVSKESVFKTLNAGAITPISTLTNVFNPITDYIEVHIENEGVLIKSHYDYDRYKLSTDYGAKNNTYPSVDVDPILDLEYYGYISGEFTVQYNFFRRIFSSSLSKSFFVKEISPSRKEIRLSSNTLTNDEIELNFTSLSQRINALNYVSDLVFNVPGNIQSQIINIALDKDTENFSIRVKLDDPLDISITQLMPGWIVEQVSLPTRYVVDLVSSLESDSGTKIKGPNFNIGINNKAAYVTDYQSYENLAGDSNRKDLLRAITEKNIQINVDYNSFSNFVHFSSVEDRINVFIDKVTRIETLNTWLTTITNLPDIDRARFLEEKETIINQFDGYEAFLYFEHSGSNPNVYPKEASVTKPYTLVSVNSYIVADWYNNIIAKAKQYDTNNYDYIWHSIPSYIQIDENNENLRLFINGLGHHYDNIWIYIKSIGDLHVANNSLEKGISKDVVREMLVSFGVKLYNSSTESDLQTELVGTNNNFGLSNLDAIPTKTYNQELYKRIYHNLPLLLKSKGSERGIRSLLSIYGIPSEILSIDKRLSSFAADYAVKSSTDITGYMVGTAAYFSTRIKVSNILPKFFQFKLVPNGATGVFFTLDTFITASITYNTNKIRLNFNVGGSPTYCEMEYYVDRVYVVTLFTEGDTLKIRMSWDNESSVSYVQTTQSQWNTITDTMDIVIGKNLTGNAYISDFKSYRVEKDDQQASDSVYNPYMDASTEENDLLSWITLGLNNELPRFRVSNAAFSIPVTTTNVNDYYDFAGTTQYTPYQANNYNSTRVIYAKWEQSGEINGVYVVTDLAKFNSANTDGAGALSKSFKFIYWTKDTDLVNYANINPDSDYVFANIKQDIQTTYENLVDVSISKSRDINKDILNILYNVDINGYFSNPEDLYNDTYTNIHLLRKKYFESKYTKKYTNNDYIILANYINTSLFKMIEDFTPIGVTLITGVSVQPIITDRSKHKYQRNIEIYNGEIEWNIDSIEIASGPSMDINVEDSREMYNGQLKGIDLDVGDILDNVGANPFITHKATSQDKFDRSLDNTLYGNVHDNKAYEYRNPNEVQKSSGCKRYSLYNPWIATQYVTCNLCNTGQPYILAVPGGFTIPVCTDQYPIVQNSPVPESIGNWEQYKVRVTVVNQYGCEETPVVPEDDALPNAIIEFQEYYTNLSSFTLPRYEGSKTYSRQLNVWEEGDSSYGKTAAVDSYVNQIGLFSRAYSGSIGAEYCNVTLKYLVDRDGSFVELNELNRNLFDVQNLFKLDETATISLFNPMEFSNQKNTNGVKKIFSSGYYYKPIFYFDSTEDSLQFETDDDVIFSRFAAQNNFGFIKWSADPTLVNTKAIINAQNTYDIYKTFENVVYNSANSFKLGNEETRTFPYYTVIDGSLKYSFEAVIEVTATFPANTKTELRYQLDVVRSETEKQTLYDKVLGSEIVSLKQGYKVYPMPQEWRARTQGHVIDSGIKVTFAETLYDDVNGVTLPTGTYTVYAVESEYVTPQGDLFWDVHQDRYWYYYLRYNGIFYKYGEKVKTGFIITRTMEYEVYVKRTLNVKTDWLTDLVEGGTVYFRLRKLDSNTSLSEFINPTGKATVAIEVNELDGALLPAIESTIGTDMLMFNESISKFYGYTQMPTNQAMIDKYGIIEGPFMITKYDIITIKHADSTKKYVFQVMEVFVNNDKRLCVRLDRNLPATILYSPKAITEFVVSSRTKDETNVVMSFTKAPGETSYGILIPKNIHPDFMDHIDTVTKEIKQKLINENIKY